MSSEKLIEAMHEGDPAQLLHLLETGSDPNGKTDEGDYPLQVAYRYAIHKDIGYEYLEILLAAGADLNRQFIPPLHGACHAGDLRLVEYLIDHGADPLLEDGDGDTPHDWTDLSSDAGREIAELLSSPQDSIGEQAEDANPDHVPS